eukprot:CAMPEP_0119049962 /NCGR_PEP_ID=MMETSP1177-20130426/67456_1 /TAXON_ID=2985 /ORGANISM="Ochromonas sp, Strain CCMP1899" /LENGTH=216 /DNA_ID=CAMNT_0007027805 /DNA_START=519 /DNA_END=1165 /DNA_ORIENTATION=-
MTTGQPSISSTGSPAPYVFDQQKIHHYEQKDHHYEPKDHHYEQDHQYFDSPSSPPIGQNKHHSLSYLQQQQRQQQEEEELNQLFTRSLSVPPGPPLSSYQRNEDSVLGTSDDVNNSDSSFVYGNSAANIGLIRPASTGSVNLDSNSSFYPQPIHQSSSFSFNSFPRHTPFGRTGGGEPPDSPPGIGTSNIGSPQDRSRSGLLAQLPEDSENSNLGL